MNSSYRTIIHLGRGIPVFHLVTGPVSGIYAAKCGARLIKENCVRPSKRTAENLAYDGVDCKRCFRP